jgi:hypothetical protein
MTPIPDVTLRTVVAGCDVHLTAARRYHDNDAVLASASFSRVIRLLATKLTCRCEEPRDSGQRCLLTMAHGENMPRPQYHDDTLAPAILPGRPHTRYLVVRQDDVWFIKFDGEEYGPYKSEREALLFAIDAAQKLGEQGEEAQVLLIDEGGEAHPAFTYGQDPYPPRI